MRHLGVWIGILLLPLALSASEHRIGMEAEEPHEFDSNCVPESLSDPPGSFRCPEVFLPTGNPSVGVRVLDSVALSSFTTFFVNPPRIEGGNVSLTSSYREGENPYGLNLHYATGGFFPDVLLPGLSRFHAWYGYFHDTNGDGTLYYDPLLSPRNEWQVAGLEKVTIVSYVEPGPHPQAGDYSRPSPSTPDFAYDTSLMRPHGFAEGPIPPFGGPSAGTPFVVFPTGSILEETRVLTVTNPLYFPDERGLPFLPSSDSLVDDDRYVSLLPEPLRPLYDSIASPILDGWVGSPGISLCQNVCRVPPPWGGTGLEGILGGAYRPLWALYPPEWEVDSLSSNAGALVNHTIGFAPWIDLLLGTDETPGASYLYSTNFGPLPPSSEGPTLPSVRPGTWIAFEIWMGLWRDLSGDGRVGWAGVDPYESGTRPFADRYESSGGEFLRTLAFDSTGSHTLPEVEVKLVPDPPGWPSPGVFVPELKVSSLFPLDPAKTLGGFRLVTGETPIEWKGRSIPSGSGGPFYGFRPASYVSSFPLFFPSGTLGSGFLACTDPLHLVVTESTPSFDEIVFDCDRVGRI